jgi:hypothetical protein
LLALHLSEGGKPELAVPHWTEAARRSLKRSALTEATRLLRRGIASLGEGWTELRLQLTALLGPALIGLNGPKSIEARHLYESAASVCQALPEDAAFFPIYWGWWRTAKDVAASHDRAEAMLRRAELLADDGLLLEAHHCAWRSNSPVCTPKRDWSSTRPDTTRITRGSMAIMMQKSARMANSARFFGKRGG